MEQQSFLVQSMPSGVNTKHAFTQVGAQVCHSWHLISESLSAKAAMVEYTLDQRKFLVKRRFAGATLAMHCAHMGPHLGDPVPMGTFFSFWVSISVPRSPFSLIRAKERMKSLYSHYLMLTI